MRLAFESVHSVDCLPSVGGHHSIHRGPASNRGVRRRNLPLLLPVFMSWDIGLLRPLDWALYHWLPWLSGFWTRITSLVFLGLLACK